MLPIRSVLPFLLAGTLIAGCADDDSPAAGSGSLVLQISASPEVQAVVTSLAVSVDGGAAIAVEPGLATGLPVDDAAGDATAPSDATDAVTAATALLPAASLRGLFASATLTGLPLGRRTIVVEGFAGDASDPVARATAAVEVADGQVSLLALDLWVGAAPVAAGITSSLANVQNHTEVEFSAVVTAAAGVAFEVVWSDDCGGAFGAPTAPTTSWIIYEPATCKVTATVTQDGESDTFTLDLPVAVKPGTLEVIAGGACTKQGKAGWWEGISPLLGENGPAVDARFTTIRSLAFGPDGDLYLADREAGRILKIELDTGILRRVAGPAEGSTVRNGGNGGPATAATLYWPGWIAFSNEGTAYVSETFGYVVRALDPVTNYIQRFVGTGSWGETADGGAMTGSIANPMGQAVAPDGRTYLADRNYNRIYRYYPSAGTAEHFIASNTVASADSGKYVSGPFGLAAAADGDLILAERGQHVIARYDAATKARTVIAGTAGVEGDGADSGTATAVALRQPFGVRVLADGRIVIADTFNHKIRVVGSDGKIKTVVGPSSPVLGKAAIDADRPFEFPTDAAVDGDGNVYFGEKDNCRVWKAAAAL